MEKRETEKEPHGAAEKELHTIAEVCAKTGLCYRTIHRHVRAGRIKSIRLGASVMIPRRELERILVKGF